MDVQNQVGTLAQPGDVPGISLLGVAIAIARKAEHDVGVASAFFWSSRRKRLPGEARD
jgi:hypothetical protein